MAKARWVKPEFFTDDALCALSERAALVFEALWTEADDGNVAPGDPVVLYGRCFIKRRDWTAETVEACFAELEGAGMIRRGEHRGKRWILIPHLMEHQGTKPKYWRHLGKAEHQKIVAQIFREKRRKAAQCSEPSTFTPKPLLEPKPEPVAVAVAEAGSVLRTGLAPAVHNPQSMKDGVMPSGTACVRMHLPSVQPQAASVSPEGRDSDNNAQPPWDSREAAKQLRALCYRPDGKPPEGLDIAEDLRWWKRCRAAGQTDGRILAALHGLPHLVPSAHGKWSPARLFSKQGDWVSLFERAVTEDGKHGRPVSLGETMQRLSAPPLTRGAAR